MTLSDARKRSDPSCPGVNQCEMINAVLDHEFAFDAQAAEAIRQTCEHCGRNTLNA